MAKDENVKRRRKKRERQDWDPHWSIKTLYTLGSAALSALKIAIGGCLAVALCAACLFAAVASGAGLMALAALNLGENVSPSQRYLQDREESLNWIADALAARYAAKTAPKADEALVEQYYSYLDRGTALENANYEILDSKGKVLERRDGQTGSFTDFTFRIAKGDRTYVEVLEGPIYVETMEEGQQAARKLAGKDALEEDFFPGNFFPIREELADGGCIYAIDYKDGWNIYKIQDVPLKENYTVVIHADLTAGDNALEARLFSLRFFSPVYAQSA